VLAGLLHTQAIPAPAALPTFPAVKAAHTPSEAWLLDRHGAPLQTLRVDERVRRLPWISLTELSPAMIQALLASEDKRFMRHSGVDWRAVAAAMWDNLSGTSHRGASTLSMQLVGLLEPTLHRPASGRSMGQKWDQMREARKLERTWSKQQILEAYLNRVNFRGELAGIHAAAQGLFHKHPSGLNQAEASILAALLRGPNAQPGVVARRACGVAVQIASRTPGRPGNGPASPWGGSDAVVKPGTRSSGPQPVCAQIRRLARMTLGAPPRIDPGPQLAPHFTRQFVARLGRTPKGGESLTTPLDAHLQRLASEALERHLVELRGRQVMDGAVVVLDNQSGEILAYVGASSRTSISPEVDGVLAPRLPGSTLKPFLYGLAIEQGLLTAASPLEDSPLALDTPTGQYMPQNYERDFKGWVSVRTALGASLNVPAVRTLLLVGEERFLQRLRDLGLATLKEDADFYGYALALGGGEVTLLALGNAYRALANGGLLKPVVWLPQSTPAGKGKAVMGRAAAWIIADILADKTARATTFGLDSPLETRGWAGVKTGTSKDMRDNWCVGFTPRYTVAVWVGNASGEPMHDISGISGAAPIWQTVMNALQADRPAVAPALPPGVERRTIRYAPAIEPMRQEVFLAGSGMDLITLAPPEDRPSHIEGPAHGSVLALDPDIPAARQKVRFRALPMATGLSWRIDGHPPHPDWLQPDGSLLWPPHRGAFRLTLHAADGSLLDARLLSVK